MSDIIIIGVPTNERADLSQLAKQMQSAEDFTEHRYFDGATFVEIILPTLFTTGTWSVLRTWIRARSEARKATRITWNGIEITAMNAKDAERILRILTENLKVGDENE